MVAALPGCTIRTLQVGNPAASDSGFRSLLPGKAVQIIRPPSHHSDALVEKLAAHVYAAHRASLRTMSKLSLYGVGIEEAGFVQKRRGRRAEAVGQTSVLV